LNILANENKLSREFLEGGTICMTDVGAIAGISSNPLILYPQVCIVAIGRVCEAPCFFGGHYVKKKYVTMSFGCDHRVINGAEVGKFSNDWKNFL
jgi:pyruvate/2-oxoglutarate dehydrogenase complex dihydrolipoamide acyltransferase (E2) component